MNFQIWTHLYLFCLQMVSLLKQLAVTRLLTFIIFLSFSLNINIDRIEVNKGEDLANAIADPYLR